MGDTTRSTVGAELTEADLKVKLAMKRQRAVDASESLTGAEDYQLLLSIGHGGFGDVFLARQISLERRVAVKLSNTAPQEGSVLAKLNHPNILRVFDQRRLEDGHHMIVMELVPGGSLKTLLREARDLHGPLTGDAFLERLDARVVGLGEAVPLDSLARVRFRGASAEQTAVTLAAEVAAALAHAHEQGVLHCDVKSDNVLVDAAGHVRLADFNVSQSASASPEASRSGVGGTAAYMAPEILDAHVNLRPDVTPTTASDVFSFGVLFWETLTGTRPFEDDPEETPDARIAARRRPPPVPAEVPESWRRIYELAIECLNPDPTRRPSSASLREQLRHWSRRDLAAYFQRPLRGVLRHVADRPYLGTVPIHFGSTLGAYLSARFCANLLAPYPEAQRLYAARIPGAIVVNLLLGVVLALVLIRYLKHVPGAGTELEAERLAYRARRRDRTLRVLETGSAVAFLLWTGTGLLKAATLKAALPALPAAVVIEQWFVTSLFGAIFVAFLYTLASWYVFEVFYPNVLQATLEKPPTARWVAETRLRTRVALCGAAVIPAAAITALASLGFENLVGLTLQLILGAAGAIAAFAIASRSQTDLRTLEDAFGRDTAPAA